MPSLAASFTRTSLLDGATSAFFTVFSFLSGAGLLCTAETLMPAWITGKTPIIKEVRTEPPLLALHNEGQDMLYGQGHVRPLTTPTLGSASAPQQGWATLARPSDVEGWSQTRTWVPGKAWGHWETGGQRCRASYARRSARSARHSAQQQPLLWAPGTQNRQPHTPHHLQAKQALQQWAGLPRRHYLGLTHHGC